MRKGWFFLALVVLFAFPVFSVSAATTNLLNNGNFETDASDGSAYGWVFTQWGEISASATYPDTGRSGKGYRISVSSADENSDEAGALVRQKYPLFVREGERYVYSDMIRGDGVSVHLDVKFIMKDGSERYRGIHFTKTYPEWKKTTKRFVVPKGAVAMDVYRVIDDVGWFSVDDASLRPAKPLNNDTGYVSFTFDDNRIQSALLPILDQTGIRATFYMNPQTILENAEPGITTTREELARIVLAGHEIGNHSLTHLSLVGLPADTLREEIVGGKDALEALVGRSVLTFAYPYGDTDDASVALVREYHIGARGVLSWEMNTQTSPDKMLLNALCVESTQSVAEVAAMIDDAYNRKQWLVLCFHQIDHTGNIYSYRPEDLSALIEHAKAKMPVITVREGISRYMK